MRKLKLHELGRKTVEEYKQSPKNKIVLVLDNIRSAMNVGSMFRTADAFGLKSLMLCGITATPPHREIMKTAIGADQSVDWQYFDSSIDCIKFLKEKHYQIIGVEQTNESITLNHLKFEKSKAYALVFGNEVQGLSNDLLPLLDHAVEIPQFGTKHSLNVSVCAGAVIWECWRQMYG